MYPLLKKMHQRSKSSDRYVKMSVLFRRIKICNQIYNQCSVEDTRTCFGENMLRLPLMMILITEYQIMIEYYTYFAELVAYL